jgi:hypothetical protein
VAFLAPAFSHDVFVSYAHGDPTGDGDSPLKSWVTDFVKALRANIVAVETEFDPLEIWFDNHLDPTAPLTDALRQTVKTAGILLIIMSPRYLKSRWCNDERTWFREEISARVQTQGRVFIVRALPTQDAEWPDFLRDDRGHAPTGFRFYEPNTGRPFRWQSQEAGSHEYSAELWRLSTALVRRLRELRSQQLVQISPSANAPPASSASPTDAALQVRLLARRPCEDVAATLATANIRAMVAAISTPERDLTEWQAERRLSLALQDDFTALALVRTDTDKSFLDDLLDIGVDDRRRMEAQRGTALPCAVLDNSGHDFPVDLTPFGIRRFDLSSPDWLAGFQTWLADTVPPVPVRPHAHRSPRADLLPPFPYPGLRPFEPDEWMIFFGREHLIDAIIDRLSQQRMVLIHGASGSGKSSLVRAGVLPKLARQFTRHGAVWCVGTMRPSGGPLWNLAAVLAHLSDRTDDAAYISNIVRMLNRHGASLADTVAQLPALAGKKICILVDQFEELFRFEQEGSREEAELFVHLLTTAIAGHPSMEADSALHLIITMRSEFLGECARFDGFAEAVNQVQYLVPRLSHADLLRAVRHPARLYGGEVTLALAERLIAEAHDRADALPLIQHGLMLFWHAQCRNSPNQPPLLDQTLLPTSGGLTRILSEHAGQVLAMAAPTAEQRVLVEKLFRALIDTNAEGLAIRRPLRFATLAAECGAAPEALRPLIDAFRAVNVSFLTPYPPAEIVDNTVINISHEALIRCWDVIADPLRGWLKREIDDGLIWRSLVVQAHDFFRDKNQILSLNTMIERLRWVGHINKSWTDRHGGEWNSVAILLTTCKKKEGRQFFGRLFGGIFALSAIIFTLLVAIDSIFGDYFGNSAKSFERFIGLLFMSTAIFSLLNGFLLFILNLGSELYAFVASKLTPGHLFNVNDMPISRQHQEDLSKIYKHKIPIFIFFILAVLVSLFGLNDFLILSNSPDKLFFKLLLIFSAGNLLLMTALVFVKNKKH